MDTIKLVLACRNPWRFVVAGLRTGLKPRRLRRASTTWETNVACLFLFLLAVGAAAQAANSLGPLDLTEDEVRTKEVGVGSLVADAIRTSAKTDAAFLPAAVFKKVSIPAGDVTADALNAALVFADDTITVLELQGSDLRAALERSVSIFPQKNLGFLQVSGIQLLFDPSSPAGKRLTSVKVAGKPIKDDATYRIATSNSLANGALGYWRIWKKEQIRQKTNVTLGKAVESFVSGNKALDYQKADRIVARGQ